MIKANETLYRYVSQRLLSIMQSKHEDIIAAFASMGPSDFLSDLSNEELIGANKVFDWIINEQQFNRGKAQGQDL